MFLFVYTTGTGLMLKQANTVISNSTKRLPVLILTGLVLAPVFGIADPKTDPRLKCVGGEKAMEEIDAIIENHPDSIGFTICPLTVEQLIAVADADEILPPKSTWIVPKIPYGLLLHNHLTL